MSRAPLLFVVNNGCFGRFRCRPAAVPVGGPKMNRIYCRFRDCGWDPSSVPIQRIGDRTQMNDPNVSTGYVFGTLLTVGGLLTAIFVDKSTVSGTGVSGAFDVPMWAMGLAIVVFGVVVLWRTVLLHRKQ
jgi:hypothetical protein